MVRLRALPPRYRPTPDGHGAVLVDADPAAPGRAPPGIRRSLEPAAGDPSDPRYVPPPLPGFLRERLGPEARLQVAAVAAFRPRLVDGARLWGTCGELRGGRDGEEERYVHEALIRRAMGYQAGTPDLLALRPNFVGVIELKRPAGDQLDLTAGAGFGRTGRAGELSAPQRRVRDWCGAVGWPWARAEGLVGLESVLLGWGMIQRAAAP